MTSKRETVQPRQGDKRYIRRDARGRFTSSQDDTGRSLSADRRQGAAKTVRPGRGDRGDRRR